MNPTDTTNPKPIQPGTYQGQTGADIATYGFKGTTGVYSPQTQQTPIDVGIIGNTQPFKLQTPPTPTYGGVPSIIDGVLLDSKNQRDAQALEQKEQTKDSALQALLSETIQSGQISSSVDRAAEDKARMESDKYTSMLEAEQLSNRRAIESLQKNNPQGLFGGALQQEVNRLERDSLSKQADIAILQTTANRNYDTARSIADRQVEMKMEQSKARLSALKFFYEENRDAFNKAEERQYNEMIKKEDREFEKQEDLEKLLSDTKLELLRSAVEQEAPEKIKIAIQNAKTPEDAITSAGVYGSDMLNRELQKAQLDNIRSQISERNSAASSYGTVTGKPQTAAQASANGYANRVAEADVIISNLGKQFTGKFAFGGSMPNLLQSGDRQMYEQAKRNFVNAVLRRESGAAIAESEFVSAEKQYFPQAGDSAGVVAQKEMSRNTTINNLYRESAVNRPVLPGQIIMGEDGTKYKVGMDGETLDIIE